MSKAKDLLAAAAGPNGKGDENWHAARADRLYFFDPRDVDAAGSVDVRIDGDKEPDYVRVELFVRPELAAEVIALMTGERESVERRLRFELTSEIRAVVIAEIEAKQEPEHKPPPENPRGVVARTKAARVSQDQIDAERSAELDRLIREQFKEEAAEAVEAAESLDAADPSDPLDGDADLVAEAEEIESPAVGGEDEEDLDEVVIGSVEAPVDFTASAKRRTRTSRRKDEDDEEAA